MIYYVHIRFAKAMEIDGQRTRSGLFLFRAESADEARVDAQAYFAKRYGKCEAKGVSEAKHNEYQTPVYEKDKAKRSAKKAAA